MSTEWFAHQPTWIAFFKFLYPYVYLDYENLPTPQQETVARGLQVKPKLLHLYVGKNEELLILMRSFENKKYRFVMVDGRVADPVCLVYATHALPSDIVSLDNFVTGKFQALLASPALQRAPSNTTLEDRVRQELTRTASEYLAFIEQLDTKSFVDQKHQPLSSKNEIKSTRPLTIKPTRPLAKIETGLSLGAIQLQSRFKGTFSYSNGGRELQGIRFTVTTNGGKSEVYNDEMVERITEAEFEQFLPVLDYRVTAALKSGKPFPINF